MRTVQIGILNEFGKLEFLCYSTTSLNARQCSTGGKTNMIGKEPTNEVMRFIMCLGIPFPVSV